jgi:hypothetical protein
MAGEVTGLFFFKIRLCIILVRVRISLTFNPDSCQVLLYLGVEIHACSFQL